MRKIDTWLFIVFFIMLYLSFFLLFTLLSAPLFTILVAAQGYNVYIISLIAFAIAFAAFFLAAFGLRSYYLLPASSIKLATVVVILQLLFSMIGIIVEKQFSPAVFGLTLLNAIATWLVVYLSFKVSDRYFSK